MTTLKREMLVFAKPWLVLPKPLYAEVTGGNNVTSSVQYQLINVSNCSNVILRGNSGRQSYAHEKYFFLGFHIVMERIQQP